MTDWVEWRMPSDELAQLKFAVVPVALAPFTSSDGAIEWACENGVVGMYHVTKIEVLTGNLVHAAKDTDPKANTSTTNQAGVNLHLTADILLNGVCDVNGVPLLDNGKEG